MTDVLYSNGDTVTFANGDIATFEDSSVAHINTNDRVFIPPIKTLSAGVKPTGPVAIDWNHPATAGMTLCALPTAEGDLVDLAKTRVQTVSRNANQSIRGGPGGIASYASSDKHYSESSGPFPIDNGTGDFTVVAVWKGGGDSTSGPALYHQRRDQTQFDSIIFRTGRYYNDGGTSSIAETDCLYFGTFDAADNWDARGITISNAVTGDVQCAVCVREGTWVTVFLDGVKYSRDTTRLNDIAGFTDWGIGGWATVTTSGHTDDIYAVYTMESALPDALAKDLSLDPYQFLKPAVPETTVITTAPTADDRLWII